MNSQATVFHIPASRRRFLKSMTAVSAGFTLPGYLAEALTLSPTMTQGPFYPLASNIPLDKDNDLVQLNDGLTLASGVVSYVSGRVLDANGSPIRGALVELWHADREGDYLYSASLARNLACDTNFAGFGQFLTGSSGEFLFRPPARLVEFRCGVPSGFALIWVARCRTNHPIPACEANASFSSRHWRCLPASRRVSSPTSAGRTRRSSTGSSCCYRST